MAYIELIFDTELNFKTQTDYDVAFGTYTTVDTDRALIQLISDFSVIEEIKEKQPTEQIEENGARFITFKIEKVDKFIKFLNKRTKNELLSLAVVRNFDNDKTLFVNKFNKKKWVKQYKKFY
ncbi:MAG: hypothetical protein ACJ0G0_04560 [Alphaproteobacteria bacterium]